MRTPRFRSAVPFLCLAGILAGCRPEPPPKPAAAPPPPVAEPARAAAIGEPQADDWFSDVTTEVGVKARYVSGRSAGLNTIIETVGGGVGLVDFDRDRRLDFYAVGGGQFDRETGSLQGVPGSLWRQSADDQFQDVTAAARLTDSTGYSHGILAADYDNDGFADLFLTCYDGCVLWRNLGDGTFETVSNDVGMSPPGWHTAAAFADVNGDGLLDLFVADYVDWQPGDLRTGAAIPSDVPPPQQYAPQSDHLFLNRGDGQFDDATTQAGVRTDGMGLGVLAADFNQDGRADLYVANDVVANHLYWGGETLPLREAGESSGVAYNESGTPEGSMGVDAADVNGDGRLDLWVTNFELEDNSLYLNLGEGLFQHSTARMGLAGIGRSLVGFGTGFHDFDGDGWPDLYILNGHVQYHSTVSPFRQPAVLLRNRDGQRFDVVTQRGGPWFSQPHSARGGAVGDWNNDGAPDLVVSSLDEPLTLLRNRLPVRTWLRLELVGTGSPRDPIGATITGDVKPVGRVHAVKSGSGYLSQSDSRITLSVTTSMDSVTLVVLWPSRLRERFQIPPRSGDVVIVEGRGTAVD